ncbi:MAG: NHL repeat-containing protein [Dehalococcoidia bacterium]
MSPSLTTSAAGRAYDFSHVVGGRQITGVVNMAFGQDDDVYVTKKALAFFDVERLKIGTEPGDEEVITSFKEVNPGFFDEGWPSCVAVAPNLDVYVTDELRHFISVFDREGKFIRNIGEHGNQPGHFDRPSGIVFAEDGSFYVSDTKNHRIQHLTATGEHLNSFGAQGSAEGEFQSPWGICLDSKGNVLVADHANNRIQKFDQDGTFISTIGSPDPGSGAGQFNHPSDVAVDPDGDIYVCDWASNRVQMFDESEEYVLQMGGSAFELLKWQKRYIQGNPDVYKARRRVDTLDPETHFALPTGVEFDSRTNRLFVVDSQRWRIQIFNKLEDYAEPQFNI